MKINFSISEDNYYVEKCVRIYQSLGAVIDITSKCHENFFHFFYFLLSIPHLFLFFLQMWITSVYNTGGK